MDSLLDVILNVFLWYIIWSLLDLIMSLFLNKERGIRNLNTRRSVLHEMVRGDDGSFDLTQFSKILIVVVIVFFLAFKIRSRK